MITLGGLHSRSNSHRLYVPTNEGRRGLISVKDCADDRNWGVARYTVKSNG